MSEIIILYFRMCNSEFFGKSKNPFQIFENFFGKPFDNPKCFGYNIATQSDSTIRQEVTNMTKITIRAARKNAGLTIVEAAKWLHIATSTLSSYENGKTLPRLNILIAMCHLYGCDLGDLREGVYGK